MKRKNRKGTWLIRAGWLLIAAGLAIAGWNFYEEYRAGADAREAMAGLEALRPTAAVTLAPLPTLAPDATGEPEIPAEMELPDYVVAPDMEMPVIRHNGQDYIGTLEIPAIGLEIPVISKWNYPRLRIAPCRYYGSAYTNDLVISAHNYRTHFGNINQLKAGDVVRFTDADGNVFHYTVSLRETLGPKDVYAMTHSDFDLTLFTCTVGGSYRVTVRCERDPMK